ncbi:CBS domain-containing protein [Membranihabitans maritimus]|uniref:CBS domain-containing protein n=1 Tax=Membranihabitans maritimus TaxID=2904244 RepID=UPI001F272246|nr:CBS domain-containing protein [Membranihabitans maritimus]
MKNFKQKEVPATSEMAAEPKRVKEYMTDKNKLITFHPDTHILDVAQSLLQNRITGAPVLNQMGDVVGLIDDKDCLRIVVETMYHNHPVLDKTASHYMSNIMKSVNQETDINEAANIFLTTPYKRLLVIDDDGKLRGQISRRDILKALFDMD